jgi:hypothetical protein
MKAEAPIVHEEGGNMKSRFVRERRGVRAATALMAISCFALAGFGVADKAKPVDGAPPLTVPKATCGPNDHPETDLQGQVSAAKRASGFGGFNCNLELIGQSKGDGANWQTTQFTEGRTRCAYYGTAFTTANPEPRRCSGRRHHRAKRPDAEQLSGNDVDARPVGIAEGQRAAQAPCGDRRA